MRSPVRFATVALGLFIAVAATGLAQRAAPRPAGAGHSSDATARIVAAAQAVLATLDEAGRAKVQFPFDGPQKTRWSNLPSGMFQREGLRLGDLTPPQRAAVMTLLSTALSRDGYRKVTEIMRGDEVLRTDGRRTRRGGGPRRRPRRPRGRAGGRWRRSQFGEDEYYLAFLGTPSATTPWMLQFGGHHLAINLTLAGSQATMAPSLPAAQPATYTFEGRDRSSARQGERQGVRADQRARRGAAQPGDPRLPRRRSRARPRPGRPHDSAGRHPRVGALGGAADDAAGSWCGSGRAS